MFGVGLGMLLVTIGLVLLAGAVTAVVLYSEPLMRITVIEFTVVALTIIFALVPGVSYAGTKAAQSEAVSGYYEFWGSSLKSINSDTETCTRDGDCVHTYECDPYPDWHYVTRSRSVPDGKGGTTTEYYQSYEQYTAYHDCPYVTQETTYWVVDWFDREHVMGHSWFDKIPVAWRKGVGIPKDVPRGQPQQWASALRTWQAGDPEPVVKDNTYTNYLLAAYDRSASEYEDDILDYQSQGLIVEHTKNLLTTPLHHFYLADKMTFVGGLQPVDEAKWQAALAHVNARFGIERQGDLHVVALPADKVSNPDRYMGALLAYNQSRKLGKKALGKNAVYLVIGVNTQTNQVEWSRAKTGVPEGNGAMLSALGDLYKQPFEPRSLLGWPTASQNTVKLTFTPSGGVVERIIADDFPFLRPCMDCKDKGDHGTGYVYLKSSAYISTVAQVWICIIVFILSMALFGLAAYYDFTEFFSVRIGRPSQRPKRRQQVRATKRASGQYGNRPNDASFEAPTGYYNFPRDL